MSTVVGGALDDFVGAVINKKDDAGFLAQVDREFLDTELRMLKEQVESYRQAQQAHKRERGELDDKLASELSNQKDIFMYLNGELAKKTDEILELQERVQQLLDENERMTLDNEARMLTQKDAAQLHAAKLSEEINTHKASLAKVQKFISEKSDISLCPFLLYKCYPCIAADKAARCRPGWSAAYDAWGAKFAVDCAGAQGKYAVRVSPGE